VYEGGEKLDGKELFLGGLLEEMFVCYSRVFGGAGLCRYIS